MYFYYFIFNVLTFSILLKLFLIILKDKYIFPFRVAEIVNLISNLILNIFITIYFFNYEYLINVIIINFCLSFIFYNMLSMVNTSSRTKILLDILEKGKIDIKKYSSKYNEKIILDNRIYRLKTNNEIQVKKNFIKINDNGIKFFKVVIFVFSILKKI